MLKSAVAIRHIAFEDLGFFEAPLHRAGYDIRYLEPGRDDLGAANDADLLVVLGGPMGVYEVDRYPSLAQECEIIARRVGAGKVTLGICLGAQLIAAALGARVYPGCTKEIGFAPISLTRAGRSSPLSHVPEGQSVLHWHGDTFDLPAGAACLASTADYPQQAFSIDDHVLALQFHLEAGADIERWITGHADEILEAGVDPNDLRRGSDLHSAALVETADAVLTGWLAQTRR